MNAVVCSRCNCVIPVNGAVPPQCPDCGSTLGNTRDVTRSLPLGTVLAETTIQTVHEQPVTIGRYIVERELGSGGFGIVYLAKDEKLNRPVAIKLPKVSRLEPHHKERFAREARNAAQLRHRGIVSVYNVEEEGNLVFIVSEYVAGLPLDRHLKQNEISFRTAASLTASIAWAVEYAHSQKIIHRDIKPSNIMIDAEGNPRLMDFGLAKREEADERITAANQVIGTPAFMSPEQAWGKQGKTKQPEGEHKVDRRSDVYSLGAVLYQLLTRELPFRGEPQVVRRKVIEDDPKRPREINAQIPVDLERICTKAMAKEPSDRYRTAGDLAADLERWLRGEPILARHVGPLERSWRWSRRNPLTSGLIALIALLVTATAFCATAMYAMEHKAKTRLEQALLEKREMLSMAYVRQAGRHLGPDGVVEAYSPIKALPWLYAAMAIDENDPSRRDASRLRLGAALRFEPTLERVWSHHGSINDGGISPSGDCFFTAGNDGTTRLWPLSNGGTQISPLMHPAGVRNGRFSPDGKLLLTSCTDGAARLWNTSNGQLVAGPLWNSEHIPGARSDAFDPTVGFGASGLLFFTRGSRTIQVWETATARRLGAPLLLPATAGGAFFGSQFVQGDRQLLVARSDGAISLWDFRTGKETRLTEGKKTRAIVDVGGSTAAATESPETIALWNCDSGVRLAVPLLEHSDRIEVLKFSPNHDFLAVGTFDGTVYLWNAKSWRLCWKHRAVSTRVRGFDFNSDSSVLATVSGPGSGSEGVVCMLDVGTGRPVAEPVGTVNQTIFARWVPKSDALIIGSVDGSIRLWRARGDESEILLPHASQICCAAVSSDHRVVATVDVDGACCVTECPGWRPTKPTDASVLAHLKNIPIAVAVTGDGSKIALAGRPSAISIRDVATKKSLMVLDDGAQKVAHRLRRPRP